MGDAALLTGLISFLTLIIFIVMAANIGRMKKETINMGKIMQAWSNETGIGKSYKCGSCKKSFEGKVEKCPHCGVKVTW